MMQAIGDEKMKKNVCRVFLNGTSTVPDTGTVQHDKNLFNNCGDMRVYV